MLSYSGSIRVECKPQASHCMRSCDVEENWIETTNYPRLCVLQECRNARSRCNNGVGGGGWGHTVVHHPTPVNPRHPSLPSPFPCSTSSPLSLRSRSFSPADDNLLSRLWIVFHQVKPFAKGGVAAVHCLLSSPEAFDCTRGSSSVTPLATAGAGGTHTAPARY